MTREEEIKQVAENYASQMCNDCAAMLYCEDKNKKCVERREREKVFADGAKWAEECLNLSSLWHDASEEPICGRDIIAVDFNGYALSGTFRQVGDNKGVYYNCFYLCNWSVVSKWTYVFDILSGGGQ